MQMNLFGQSKRGVKPMNQSLQQQPALINLIRLQSDDEDALADGVLPKRGVGILFCL